MYQYDAIDQHIVDERVAQFRDQTRRFLAGQLPEDDFRPLRLQNGLYVQRYAPMLRVAVPYGEMSSKQLRQLARIARELDRGRARLVLTLRRELYVGVRRVLARCAPRRLAVAKEVDRMVHA